MLASYHQTPKPYCPNCYGHLYFSGDFYEQVCFGCGYIAGDPTKGKEYLYPLSEWGIIIGVLRQQLKEHKIEYSDYCDIIENQIGISDKI